MDEPVIVHTALSVKLARRFGKYERVVAPERIAERVREIEADLQWKSGDRPLALREEREAWIACHPLQPGDPVAQIGHWTFTPEGALRPSRELVGRHGWEWMAHPRTPEEMLERWGKPLPRA
jgi:hypothetical protein